MHDIGPFSIPAMRAFVPEKLRPWIIILFVIVFQLSGGVYLAAVGEMVGSTALMQEDIMMAGYASMVGMGLTFAIMFRLKFRFASKTSFLVCCAVTSVIPPFSYGLHPNGICLSSSASFICWCRVAFSFVA